ncbi:hypothetical protein PHYSODRAFT_257686 [Phytophthora sojae]|uniref:Uncharacterized protein n=1 Tax=Phytophthora sojae (strain P6497) TaxID=1094619 RepID=G4YI43_PHYSP|nr:hypothetical protein PHYSODRAFT_257686 [Phytophthora sojae]EGZ27054.1 hypothetical protein PHYSODRAFT_257686 [Phytophthora sojae]|eukprot:XP_009514329.1 hypothetical protein PHYSODRAFT_257686 [Phytophthora sojae]
MAKASKGKAPAKKKKSPKQTPLRVNPPKSLLKQMESANVELERIKGEGQAAIRLSGVTSSAWELHREWACTRAKAPPQVDFFFAPVATHYKTAIATPMKLVGRIQVEIESLLSYIEPLRTTDFVNGEPLVLPAPLSEQDPDDDALFPDPPLIFRDTRIAMTTLVDAIANPGPLYRTIHGLREGSYICHLMYIWKSVFVFLPIIRSTS